MVSPFSLPVTGLFFAFGAVIAVHAVRNRSKPEKGPHFWNELILGFLFIAGGVLYPFTLAVQGIDTPVQDVLYLVTMVFLFAEMLLWAGILGRGRSLCRDQSLREERDYEVFKENYCESYEYDFRADLRRKALHLLPVGVILLFWILGMILDAFGVLSQFQLTQAAFSYWLIITVGFGFILMFATADLMRVTGRGHYLPSWAMEWFCGSMKTDELDTFVSSESMVLCFIPFVFTPFPIFMSVALITALADAAASLVGKKYGRRKIFKSSSKTVEGYLAGAFATFSCVLIIGSVFAVEDMTALTIVMMALFATGTFLLVDAFAKRVSDNILNPLLCGFAMFAAYILF
ncbi:MAG: phosphatidate cytidylyltransferase [Promethearchaeota archaeon]